MAGGVNTRGFSMHGQQFEIAMMVTPDGHSRLEVSRFITPAVIFDHRDATVNALGYLPIMFNLPNLDDMMNRPTKHGAVHTSEIVPYENMYRLC